MIYNYTLYLSSSPSYHSPQSAYPHIPGGTYHKKHQIIKAQGNRITVVLSLFDQFASPTLLAIPLVILAIFIP